MRSIPPSPNGQPNAESGALHPAAEWLKSTVARDSQLSTDSRAVRAGDVFVAYRGQRFDARRYIAAAIARQPSAVIWDQGGDQSREQGAVDSEIGAEGGFHWDENWHVPNLSQPHLKEACGTIAADWYGRPAEQIWSIGITGTSGKTSSALWLAQAFSALEKRCAVVGTLGIGFLDLLEETGLTTPDPVLLQRQLRGLVDSGARALAMEVSSVGLAEGRVNGMTFDVALFTNLSRDHLDYHGTMAEYEAGKAQLFAWQGLRAAVINIDDAAGERMAAVAREHGARVITFSANGLAQADLRADAIVHDLDGIRFILHGTPAGLARPRAVETSLIGAFNVANLLGVLGVLLASDVEIEDALRAIGDLKPAPGRLERVLAVSPDQAAPLVLVDYAHKPDALEKALAACRPIATARGGRLCVVFGCGGDRDAGKRPLMGAIAERLADDVVVTSDNPRSEPAGSIVDAIVAGFATAGRATIELDRRKAIRNALLHARANDVILIAGKGRETCQEVAGVKYPFSDVDEASAALVELPDHQSSGRTSR